MSNENDAGSAPSGSMPVAGQEEFSSPKFSLDELRKIHGALVAAQQEDLAENVISALNDPGFSWPPA